MANRYQFDGWIRFLAQRRSTGWPLATAHQCLMLGCHLQPLIRRLALSFGCDGESTTPLSVGVENNCSKKGKSG